MKEQNRLCEKNWEPNFAACIPVIGLGTHVTPVFQSVRSQIEEKNRNRRYREGMEAWWLWSFCQVSTGLKMNTGFAQESFKSADIFFLLVDTADETAVQNAEVIGRDATALIITILLGDGGQDMKERIASAVDCFVDLRDVRLEQYKKQETVEQLAYLFIRSIMAPMEEQQLVSMDFDDIQQMFSHGGEIHMGIGEASFETSEDEAPKAAAEEALRGLKTQCDLHAIQRSFLSLEYAEESVSILNIGEVVNAIHSVFSEDVDFIYNASISDDMKNRTLAVLLATEMPVSK